jgi:hypothetical protein
MVIGRGAGSSVRALARRARPGTGDGQVAAVIGYRGAARNYRDQARRYYRAARRLQRIVAPRSDANAADAASRARTQRPGAGEQRTSIAEVNLSSAAPGPRAGRETCARARWYESGAHRAASDVSGKPREASAGSARRRTLHAYTYRHTYIRIGIGAPPIGIPDQEAGQRGSARALARPDEPGVGDADADDSPSRRIDHDGQLGQADPELVHPV